MNLHIWGPLSRQRLEIQIWLHGAPIDNEYLGSNVHVTDDVTWPWNVKGVALHDPKCQYRPTYLVSIRGIRGFNSQVNNKKAVLSQRWPRDARYISRSWAVAEIWPFKLFKMAAAAILNLFELKIEIEIEIWVQWTTNRKWPIGIRMVTWLMTSRDPERSRSWPQYT